MRTSGMKGTNGPLVSSVILKLYSFVVGLQAKLSCNVVETGFSPSSRVFLPLGQYTGQLVS